MATTNNEENLDTKKPRRGAKSLQAQATLDDARDDDDTSARLSAIRPPTRAEQAREREPPALMPRNDIKGAGGLLRVPVKNQLQKGKMAATTSSKSPIPLVDLLGPRIILSNQDEISVAELARTKKTILLYFSAHWCPPCRGFTPTLSKAYAEYKNSRSSDDGDGPEDDDGFELVFVSSDRDAEAFREHHSEMSFPALPYESREIKAKLGEKFQVHGIPHLVAMDASTGEESSVNATVGDLRSFIVQHGAAAFPLCPYYKQKMKAKAEKKQADALQKLKTMSIAVSVPPSLSPKTNSKAAATIVKKKATIELGDLLEQHEYVGLVYGDGDKGDSTYDNIQEVVDNLGSKNFIPVYLDWTEYGDQSDHSAFGERFYSVRKEELTDEVRSTLRDAAGKTIDGLTMVTFKSIGSGLCGINGNCEPRGAPTIASIDEGLRNLRQFGPAAFPWDGAAIKNAVPVKERRVNDLKEGLAGFNFLRHQFAFIHGYLFEDIYRVTGKKPPTKDRSPCVSSATRWIPLGQSSHQNCFAGQATAQE